MKKMIFAAAALVAMTACNTSLIERPQSEYGTISLGITADVEMMVTKTDGGETGNTTETEYDENTEYDEYKVTLEGNTTINTTYGKIKKGIKVPAGTYTITVENITATDAEDGNGAKHIQGTLENVEVNAGDSVTPTINCSPVNTKVTVAYAAGFTDVFTNPTVTLENTEVEGKTFSRAALTMTAEHVDANAVYYNTTTTATINGTEIEVAALTATITATVGEAQKTFTKTFNAPVAKWTQLTFAVADGNCKLTITVNGVMTEYELDSVIDPTE